MVTSELRHGAVSAPPTLPRRTLSPLPSTPLVDVSFSIPVDVRLDLSSSIMASIPPRDPESLLSGITTIQNERSDPYLAALQRMPSRSSVSGGGTPATKHKKRRAGAPTSMTLDKGLNDLLSALSGKPAATPVATAPEDPAPRAVRPAAAPRREARDPNDADAGAPTSGAAVMRRRLERRLDELRWNDHALATLGKKTRRETREHRQRVQASRSGSGLDFVRVNLRPLSPEKRLAAINGRAALERERMRQTLAAKAQIVADQIGRAEEHANRRELKKAAEQAARRAAHIDKIHRQWLVVVALCSRARAWEKQLLEYRSQSVDTKSEAKGAMAIQTAYRVWKWAKENKMTRDARAAAARALQRCARIWLWKRKVKRRIVAASKIGSLLRQIEKTGTFPLLVRGFKFKIVRVQRGWRSYVAKGDAQRNMIAYHWDKHRSYCLRQHKQLAAELKELKDKPKKRTNKKGPDPDRVAVEEAIARTPRFEEKPVKDGVKLPLIMSWLKRHRKAYMLKFREYTVLLHAYNDEMEQLSSILAARRAMGATQREEMPQQPWRPAYSFLPSEEQLTELIKEGQAASKRTKKR